MLAHCWMLADFIHSHCSTDGQTSRRVKGDLVGPLQPLDIDEVLILEYTITHSHEDVGASAQRTRFAGMLS